MIGIGDLAAILTAAGVTIYVLGLIGLAIPIRREFTHDLSIAWYAVALIPRTVVAGQGVRIWLQLPMVLIATLLLTAAALSHYYPTAPIVPLVPFLVATLTGSGLTARYARRASGTGRVAYGAVIGFSLIGLLGQILAYVGINSLGTNRIIELFETNGAAPTASFPATILPAEPNTFVSILLIFLGSFLLGLPSAILTAPPLLKVKIVKQEENGAPEQPLGYLIAHSGGCWHFFDNEDLISIPDEQVSYVQVMKEADIPSRQG